MVLAFPAFRRGFFKVTGSVIDAALKRGHSVRLLWHEHSGKPGEDVLLSEITARWPAATVERIAPERWFVPRLDYTAFGAVIGPSLHAMPGFAGEWRYSLDYAWEQITTPAEAFNTGGHVCYVTEHQRVVHTGILAEQGLQLGTGFHPILRQQHVTGSTMTDAFGFIDLRDRDATRRRYDLNRPVLLLMALKFRVPHRWRRWVYRWTGYLSLIRQLRRWCDDRGAMLVVKTRPKNGDPGFLRRYADRYIGDEDLWPYTSARLMTVADRCVHFQSGAVMEAAFARVPQLSIRVPQPHLAAYPGHGQVFSAMPKTLQHWRGVVASMEWRERIAPYLDALDEIDDIPRALYLHRFVGQDTRAGGRVLDLAEMPSRAEGQKP